MRLVTVEQNIGLLEQALALVERITGDDYRGDGDPGAGVGQHLRHTIDFYLSFLRDLPEGRIDYDRRRRAGDLETDKAAATAAMARIIEGLQCVEDPHRVVEVRADVPPGEEPSSAWSRSTVGRELRFLVSHTVHHYALISLTLRARGIEPDPDFGMAPSTLAHRGEESECVGG